MASTWATANAIDVEMETKTRSHSSIKVIIAPHSPPSPQSSDSSYSSSRSSQPPTAAWPAINQGPTQSATVPKLGTFHTSPMATRTSTAKAALSTVPRVPSDPTVDELAKSTSSIKKSRKTVDPQFDNSTPATASPNLKLYVDEICRHWRIVSLFDIFDAGDRHLLPERFSWHLVCALRMLAREVTLPNVRQNLLGELKQRIAAQHAPESTGRPRAEILTPVDVNALLARMDRRDRQEPEPDGARAASANAFDPSEHVTDADSEVDVIDTNAETGEATPATATTITRSLAGHHGPATRSRLATHGNSGTPAQHEQPQRADADGYDVEKADGHDQSVRLDGPVTPALSEKVRADCEAAIQSAIMTLDSPQKRSAILAHLKAARETTAREPTSTPTPPQKTSATHSTPSSPMPGDLISAEVYARLPTKRKLDAFLLSVEADLDEHKCELVTAQQHYDSLRRASSERAAQLVQLATRLAAAHTTETEARQTREALSGVQRRLEGFLADEEVTAGLTLLDAALPTEWRRRVEGGVADHGRRVARAEVAVAVAARSWQEAKKDEAAQVQCVRRAKADLEELRVLVKEDEETLGHMRGARQKAMRSPARHR